MKNLIWHSAIFSFLLFNPVVPKRFMPTAAAASPYRQIYSIGDSLTDRGNTFMVTGGAIPPGPPTGQYFNGRFSNGENYLDYLANRLNIPVRDFSFGGATSGDRNVLDGLAPGLPGLTQELGLFLGSSPNVAANDLFILWIGANDYPPTDTSTFMPYDNPTTTLNNIQSALTTLIGVGAKNIMVINLPPLGTLPRTRGSLDGFCPMGIQFDSDCLNNVTLAHNMGLNSLFSAVPSDVKIIPVDTYTLLNRVMANPSEYGFTNVTDSCYFLATNTACANPDQYLFWDGQHPTSAAHRIIGKTAFRALGIPESNPVLGVLSVGFLGIGSLLRCLLNP